jgi:hypothetical protein
MSREFKPRVRRQVERSTDRSMARRTSERAGGTTPVLQLLRAAGGPGAIRVQRKVSVGRADDPQEREADRVASDVVQRAATSPGVTGDRVARKADDEVVARAPADDTVARSAAEDRVDRAADEETIQRDAIHEDDERPGGRLRLSRLDRVADDGEDDDARDERAERAVAQRGAGEALEPGVRGPIEGRLGRDLSGVRVHRDGAAHASAQALRAKAFTHKGPIALKLNRVFSS